MAENDERVASLTVQDLLEQLKTDEFEKIYITTAIQDSSKNKEEIPEERISQIKTLAEFQLEQMLANMEVSKEEQDKLKEASNYYMVPHTVIQRVNSGNEEQTREVDLYTVNDVEGNSLYNIVDNQYVTMSSSFAEKIKAYLKENYSAEIQSGVLNPDEVIEHFTPESMDEMYELLGSSDTISIRFISSRIDEFARTKGIEKPEQERDIAKEEERTIEQPEDEKDEAQNEEEENEIEEDEIADEDERTVGAEEEEQEEPVVVESYIEKIARLNHVKPAVVNTRVIENFEKVEEDTGIQLRGIYQRGDVVAVRIPYKLGYRTFLAEKSTGMSIDKNGRRDRSPKLRDIDEIEDYFRYKLRDGQDGGETGKPLRDDEGRDYTTYIDENGNISQQKYINNGSKEDMLREERQRYLAEVSEADERLKMAIEDYQKMPTRENYIKVRDIIKEKVEIDNRYNALDEQREITEKTKENTERVIERDLDDDDWFPGPPGPRSRF